MRKHLFSLVNNSTTGPDGYGSAGFPGPVGDKGEAGEPSRVEGSQENVTRLRGIKNLLVHT